MFVELSITFEVGQSFTRNENRLSMTDPLRMHIKFVVLPNWIVLK